MGELYLDGVHDLTRRIEDYHVGYEKGFTFKKDILLRITILLHTALTLIRTVVVQFLRGTSHIIAGVIHLDSQRIQMGVNDYLSLLIQASVLSVLGILTFILPRTGYKLLNSICYHFDTERQNSDVIYKRDEHSKELLHPNRQKITNAIMGILGSISAFVQTITLMLEALLSTQWREVSEIANYNGRLIAVSLRDGLSSCSSKESLEIYSAHRMAIDSFNPSALV